jgi:hypothetical protein
MSTAKRADAGAAVAGLFARSSATGGLAGRDNHARATTEDLATRREGTRNARRAEGGPAPAALPTTAARVRLGVELTEHETGYLRSLSRPTRTNGPRTLGSKFVATGVLAAAIDLLQHVEVDMHGVAAGDLAEMTQRAHDALVCAALRHRARSEDVALDTRPEIA